MAERRMFAKTIIDSDAFLDMPISARLLYYDLSVRADDDGFVDSPKKIMRTVGATQSDLDTLINKDYVIRFHTGIIVITHWHIHNYIQPDRYHPTRYQDEKALLIQDDTKAYKMINNDSKETCIQPVYKMDTQSRLDKSRLDKSSVSKAPSLDDIKNYCKDHKSKIDPNRFYSYYEAIGWILNGQPVHNWKALIDTWDQREKTDTNPKINPNAIEQLEQLQSEKDRLLKDGASKDDIKNIELQITSLEDSINI